MDIMESRYKIGFIGSGKMGSALVAAILHAKLTYPGNIICSDLVEKRRKAIRTRYGVRVTSDNKQVMKKSDIVVLSFEPQHFPEAVIDLKPLVRPEHIIISIMAGVQMDRIREYLPGKIVRMMPNAACLVGEMAAGFVAGKDVTVTDMECVRRILQCAGLALMVEEEQLDAITGLSGSGPAFVAYVFESFISAGAEEGLDKDMVRELVLKTFTGTAKLLDEWKVEPRELIEMVSSPNGTTVAGRKILEASDVKNVIRQTIKRAAQRSRELGMAGEKPQSRKVKKHK